MAAKRLLRTLSAFNSSSRYWIPVASHDTSTLTSSRKDTATRPISLVSWNIDAFSPRPIARSQLLLSHIVNTPKIPDIVFLQEVSLKARDSILQNPRVREHFLTSDAEDQSSFASVPFATLALLSKNFLSSSMTDQIISSSTDTPLALKSAFRIALPSKYRRDALCLDLAPPDSPASALRLINVHLDSLSDSHPNRAAQLSILADVLREPGCRGGLIAGDFNAISSDDHRLVEQNGLQDAWLAVGGRPAPEGATWNVDDEREDGLRPGRLDKMATIGLEVSGVEIIRPGRIEVPAPEGPVRWVPWSDHCGLRCTFTVSNGGSPSPGGGKVYNSLVRVPKAEGTGLVRKGSVDERLRCQRDRITMPVSLR